VINMKESGRSRDELRDVPEELSQRLGEAFRGARTQFDLSREDVEDHLDEESRMLVEFERKNRELSNELWMAYARALENHVSIPQFKFQDARSLMRGLVNQIRYSLKTRG
jgi:ribosome-binding protein aMBF1 (putative translation factor)